MKILIVGISVRAMVESAVQSNYSVIGLDAFGDLDMKAVAEAYSLRHDFNTPYNPEALHRASRQLSFDGIAYTSNLENHPEILSRFYSDHRILGNPPRTIESVRHWKTLFSGLKNAGFPVPETFYPDEKHKIDSKRRWLIKPLLSGGGQGVAFFRKPRPPRDRFMVQEFMPGKSCSVSFVANGRECIVLGISEQLIGVKQFGAEGFRYCGNILPLPEVLDPDAGRSIVEQARQLAVFLTQDYGLTGVNGADFILSGNRVCLTEVNPRYSASMELIERAYGLPVFHLHAEAVLAGRLPDFSLEARLKGGEFFGKTILFADKDAVAPDTQNWHARDIHDIPGSGEILKRGSPICTILTRRFTSDETFADLIRQAAMLKEEIYGRT